MAVGFNGGGLAATAAAVETLGAVEADGEGFEDPYARTLRGFRPSARGAWQPDEIRRSMRVYAVTDSAWLAGRSLSECVADALRGGATFVQLREKGIPHEDMVSLARDILPLCREAGVPFVINDDVAAAREVGADGVHVGQDDMACAEARAALGDDAIIGVSVQTLEQALKAQAEGADYLGVGAMFGTSTKTDAQSVSRETLVAICASVDIPVVIIGGIKAENVGEFVGVDFDGAAVVSAIFAADDIVAATGELVEAVSAVIGDHAEPTSGVGKRASAGSCDAVAVGGGQAN